MGYIVRVADGMRRACIYFFYDADGIVDDYVPYLLNDLTESIDELVVVVNGKLTDEGRDKFLKFTDHVIVRPNDELDVGAYKEGLKFFGWDKIAQFDELIMMNHTIMGPVYPFRESFDKMKKRNVDFWGLTKHFYVPGDPYAASKWGYIPEHIQSHFLVVKNSLLKTKAFREYWEKMPRIKSYKESIGCHEIYFTKHFADMGYTWDVSIEMDDLEPKALNPVLYCAAELVERYRSPIFKRRLFFHPYGQLLETTAGQPVSDLYRYLDKSGLYDTKFIWQNALRTMDHTDLARNLHLNYTLSSAVNTDGEKKWLVSGKRIALFCHLYYTDELRNLKPLIANIPENADIIFTTQDEDKKAIIERELACIPNHLEVYLVPNRGRDVYALLSVGKTIIDRYDYICFIHDKKVTQDKPASVGEGFARICYENTLKSKAYVENILNLFETEEHLGVYCPPKPVHGPYVIGLSNRWDVNFANTKNLLGRLGISVPIDAKKVPIAPHGSCFWFRTDAVRPLFEYDWKVEDFPEEPMPVDGTISHAIERCYAYVAQSRGYYSCIGMTDTYARNEYTTLMYMASEPEARKKLLNQKGITFIFKKILVFVLPKKVLKLLIEWVDKLKRI